MGFWGYDSWVESDNAADYRFELASVIEDSMTKEIKRESVSEYNTDGWVNVLLNIVDNFEIVKIIRPEFVKKLSDLFSVALKGLEEVESDPDIETLKSHIINFNSNGYVLGKLSELD